MDEEKKYTGKVDDEMLLQLKTECPTNQMVKKVPLAKANNVFSLLVRRVRKNINQVYDLKVTMD